MLFSWPTAAIFEVLRRALEHKRGAQEVWRHASNKLREMRGGTQPQPQGIGRGWSPQSQAHGTNREEAWDQHRTTKRPLTF
jgi:hypothetical protein